MASTSKKEPKVFTVPNLRNAFACAAYIVHPHLEIPPSLLSEKVPTLEVHRALLTNRVLFRSFTQLGSNPNPQKNAFISNLIRDSDEMQQRYAFYKTLKNELLDAIELLNNNGVQTVFIKSSKILPLDSDNFDLLIREDKRKTADEVLRTNGFSFVKASKEPFKALYRTTKNGKDYVALHLHSKIVWAGVEFLNTEDVWKKYSIKSIEDTNVGFVSPEHHVLVTLAHAFFENASVKLADLMYLVDSFNADGVSLKTLITQSSEMGWDIVFSAMLLYANSVHNDIYGVPIIPANELDAVFSDVLDKDKFGKVHSLKKRMEIPYHKPYLPVSLGLRNYRVQQLISQIISNNSLSRTEKANRLEYLFSVFLRGTFRLHKPSIKVSFIGVDSAGKTTHAKNLVDSFRERGYRASHIWTRGTFHLTQPLTRLVELLLGSASHTGTIEVVSEKRVERVKSSPSFGKVILMLLLLEHAVQLSFKSLLKRFSNNALIFDRYLHDTVVDSLLNYGQDYDSFFSRLLLSKVGLFASQPDLVVVLKVSPSTVVKRRPEEDFESVKLKSQVYEQWGKQWGAYMVDTERYSIEQNHLKVLEKALRLFYEGRSER